MLDLHDTPKARAQIIIPADSPDLIMDKSGMLYNGPCPGQTKQRPHNVVIAAHKALCDRCDSEFTAHIVRPPGGRPYLRVEF